MILAESFVDIFFTKCKQSKECRFRIFQNVYKCIRREKISIMITFRNNDRPEIFTNHKRDVGNHGVHWGPSYLPGTQFTTNARMGERSRRPCCHFVLKCKYKIQSFMSSRLIFRKKNICENGSAYERCYQIQTDTSDLTRVPFF